MRLSHTLAVLVGAALISTQAYADINVYSGQHKTGTQAIADVFTAETGIKVHIKSGASEQMAGQLVEEGKRTPADVFFSEQIPPMLSLSAKHLLSSLPSETMDATALPGVPQAQNKDWVATSGRARVVVYDPEQINKQDLPSSVLDFASKDWQGKIGYVATSGAFLEQVIAISKLDGEEAALKWLKGLKKYGKLYASNKVAMAAVERGQQAVALINNYYWYNMVKEQGGKDKVRSRLYFIGHEDPGALVTYAAMAVLAGSEHQDEAQKFVKFAVSQKGQQAFASKRAEYPLRKDVSSPFEMMPYTELEAPQLTPTTNEDKTKAIHLLEKAGLK